MPSATQKQKLLNRLYTLKKDLDLAEALDRPVFEQTLYAICRENASAAQADLAFQNLQTQFFDWNEIRVSTVREVSTALSHLSQPIERARRIISFLQEVFETAYSFSLESMQKKGLKLAEKQLERFQASNAFTVAYVLQNALGGHSLPLDDDMLRCLRRLELVDGDSSPENAQGSLEHLIPKAKGMQFCATVNVLAQEFCTEKPRCSACPMRQLCPSAAEFAAPVGGGVAVKVRAR